MVALPSLCVLHDLKVVALFMVALPYLG